MKISSLAVVLVAIFSTSSSSRSNSFHDDNLKIPYASNKPSGNVASVVAVNMSSVDDHLVPLWETFAGTVNRGIKTNESTEGVMLIFDEYDLDHVYFMRNNLGVSVLLLSDPWQLFSPNVGMIHLCNTVFVCGTVDSQLTINAAVTMAAMHGGAAATCVKNRSQMLAIKAAGFVVGEDLRGRWPPTIQGNNQVNAWVKAQILNGSHWWSKNLSTSVLGVSRGNFFGQRALGLDYFVHERVAVIMIDSSNSSGALSDYRTTQTDVLRSYTPLSVVFGNWCSEVHDVAATSSHGLRFINAGRHISLFQYLNQQPIPPQQTIANSSLPIKINPKTAYVAFSFTQGDAVGFNQKNNMDYLNAPSALYPNQRVAEKWPFGIMEGTFDAPLEPNIAIETRLLATNKQSITGKGWGYTNPSILKQEKYLQAWIRGARKAMDAMGYLDLMTNDDNVDRNDTAYQIATHMRPPPRAIIHKHNLRGNLKFPTFTEEAVEVNGVTILSDPVLCPLDSTGDIDVNKTLAAVTKSASARKYFWVFLDHTTTAGRLERVLSQLPPAIVPVNFDELIRIFQRKRETEMYQ